jgi:diguanylate cyclase (GGDEF)-like protein/hemerythrin-like metal-binding protein
MYGLVARHQEIKRPHEDADETQTPLKAFLRLADAAKTRGDKRRACMAIDAAYTCGDMALGKSLAVSRANPFAVLQDDRVIQANPAFAELFGFAADWLGGPWADLFTPRSRALLGKILAHPEAMPTAWCGGAVRADGMLFEIELQLACHMFGAQTYIWACAQERTEKALSIDHLRNVAYTDALTELPNRRMFFDWVKEAIIASNLAGTTSAVLLMDIDGLKRINCHHGQGVGDHVLRTLARRLKVCARQSARISRSDGDEFAFLLSPVNCSDDINSFASALIAAARKPILLSYRKQTIAVNVGIAVYPQHGATAEGLLTSAGVALYHAKTARGLPYAYAPSEIPAVNPIASIIEWSPEYSVGIDEIDEQHRELTNRVNAVAASLSKGALPTDVGRLLDDAITYTRFHFAAEERLGTRNGITDIGHQRNHAYLLSTLRHFSAGADTASLSSAIAFFEHWLKHHITTDDREFARRLAIQTNT